MQLNQLRHVLANAAASGGRGAGGPRGGLDSMQCSSKPLVDVWLGSHGWNHALPRSSIQRCRVLLSVRVEQRHDLHARRVDVARHGAFATALCRCKEHEAIAARSAAVIHIGQCAPASRSCASCTVAIATTGTVADTASPSQYRRPRHRAPSTACS